jgi:cystathionine beta-lyase
VLQPALESHPGHAIHIGLENVDDLKADLDRGFAALKAAA